MAPTRSKKRISTDSSTSINVQSFPAPPTMVPTKASSPARTPIHRSPFKKSMRGITVVQKQALIDNLQLEVTERARKLRAQYNLQAQGMRTRIEIRVNRIPMALRKAKMGDLLVKHSGTTLKPAPSAASRVATKSPAKALAQAVHDRESPSPQRPKKRVSEQISSADKENENVENPAKRSKPPTAAQPTRAASRKVPSSQVLSPRSANSRTIPRSPIRPTTAMAGANKTFLARPVSPLKPGASQPMGGAAGILTNMVEKAKTRGVAAARKATDTSTATTRGKRVPTAVVQVANTGRVSDSSEGSNGTVIRKPILPPKKEPVRRGVMGTLRGMAVKKAATGPAVPPKTTAAPTGRILRKRK